ncbi:hypothetical protein FQA39_LY14502 [Lamprigera yunnana]|nr:hypothetical protein FQA39_LY14502 [Lamprigera yunnana]
MFGCGDNINISGEYDTSYVTPKKIGGQLLELTTPLQTSTPFQNESSKVNVLVTNRSITKRRALTLAEFNPSDTIKRTQQRADSYGHNVSEIECKLQLIKRKHAGRRVYQMLMLNAWRRRKNEMLAVVETKQKLKDQNNKLKLQLEALHRFRISECKKREEIAAQAQTLQVEITDNMNSNRILSEEKLHLEDEITKNEELLKNLQIDTRNIKNELITKHFNFINTKCQLGIERDKCKGLATETDVLSAQVRLTESEILNFRTRIEELEKHILESELKLQDVSYNNANFQSENKELLEKFNEEYAKRKDLEKCNAKLRFQLEMAEVTLSKELNRGAWKSTKSLGLVCLNLLKNMALIMLPALPDDIFSNI